MNNSKKHPVNDAPSFPGEETGLSTNGVSIMPAMPEAAPESGTSPLYDRPGYKRCPWVETFTQTTAGPVPVVKTDLDKIDRLSALFVRCGIKRHSYKVTPGLYGAGTPDQNSEVLITANFKLTFDKLRTALAGVSAWILVLDTKGINVWCAAGKGTFSTQALVHMIRESRLEKAVAHRRLIVPQLGATGISAGKVKKMSGFRVVYGPVRAADIPAFLKKARKADKKMRAVTFPVYDRFVLTPVELGAVVKPTLIASAVLILISGFGPGVFSVDAAVSRGSAAILALVLGIVSGAFVTPVLLPFIPSRKFALKGIITGSACAVLTGIFLMPAPPNPAAAAALFLFSVTVSSYLAMNFTGATPFTSPSGVEKEMKQYIPVQLFGLVVSATLWIWAAFAI